MIKSTKWLRLIAIFCASLLIVNRYLWFNLAERVLATTALVSQAPWRQENIEEPQQRNALPWERPSDNPPPEDGSETEEAFFPTVLDPYGDANTLISPGDYRILARVDSGFTGERPPYGLWVRGSDLLYYRFVANDNSSDEVFLDIRVVDPSSATPRALVPQQSAPPIPADVIDDLIRAGTLVLPRLNPWLVAVLASAGLIALAVDYASDDAEEENQRRRSLCPQGVGSTGRFYIPVPGTVDICIGPGRGNTDITNLDVSYKGYEAHVNEHVDREYKAIPPKFPELIPAFFEDLPIPLPGVNRQFLSIWVVNRVAQRINRSWGPGLEFDGYLKEKKAVIDAKCWRQGGLHDYKSRLTDASSAQMTSEEELLNLDIAEIIELETFEAEEEEEIVNNPVQSILDITNFSGVVALRIALRVNKRNQVIRQMRALNGSSANTLIWVIPSDYMKELYEKELNDAITLAKDLGTISDHVSFELKVVPYDKCL